ncbi:unnamed protein product [Musa acuminata subsp. burmannicoides]
MDKLLLSKSPQSFSLELSDSSHLFNSFTRFSKPCSSGTCSSATSPLLTAPDSLLLDSPLIIELNDHSTKNLPKFICSKANKTPALDAGSLDAGIKPSYVQQHKQGTVHVSVSVSLLIYCELMRSLALLPSKIHGLAPPHGSSSKLSIIW